MLEITPRLRQLILLLSSDQPGEVAAAAAAIGRTLKSIGSDWHGLANGLLAEIPARTRSWRDADDQHDETDWRSMREFCLRHSHRLRPREHEFLIGLDRWRGDLTEKQYAWLAAIYARLKA